MKGWARRMLPPFGRFLAGRFHEHHKPRATYEADMDVRREAFVRSRGFDSDGEAGAQVEHPRERPFALRDREPAEDEIFDSKYGMPDGGTSYTTRLLKPRWGNFIRRSTSGRRSGGIPARR